MSYILDALRISDQQRRRGAVPSLPALPPTMLASEQPALLPYALLGVTAMAAVGIGITWLRMLPPDAVQMPPVVATPAASPARPGSVVALAAALPAGLPREPAASIPTAAAPSPRLSAAPRPATAARAPTVAAGELTGKPAAEPVAPANAVAMADLPQSIRQQLPPLQLAVHAYSGTARDRLVSINGRMLREGDLLAPDLRLEQITPEGMVLSFRGYRFRRDAQ